MTADIKRTEGQWLRASLAATQDPDATWPSGERERGKAATRRLMTPSHSGTPRPGGVLVAAASGAGEPARK